MIPDGFIQALVDECEDAENTTFVDGLITAAKSKITAGAGGVKSLISASYNGKSFAWNGSTEMSPAELLSAAREAKRIYNGVNRTISFGRFDRIQR